MSTKIIDDAGLKAVFRELERRANAGLTPWSKADLASEIGVKKQAINNWRKIPAERVPMVSRILGLKKSTLRPDLYEPVDDGLPPAKRLPPSKAVGAAHGRRAR